MSTDNKQMQPAKSRGLLAIIYREHYHVLFTHFPLSFFAASALFMVLHFVSYSNRDAYELAALVMLIAGTVILWPTAITGWITWKDHYHGAHVKIFLYKIRTAFTIIPLSILLVIWRAAFPPPQDTAWFYAYAAGIFLLLLGTIIEGYYGGKLSHR